MFGQLTLMMLVKAVLMFMTMPVLMDVVVPMDLAMVILLVVNPRAQKEQMRSMMVMMPRRPSDKRQSKRKGRDVQMRAQMMESIVLKDE